jgi:hypothetical protein
MRAEPCHACRRRQQLAVLYRHSMEAPGRISVTLRKTRQSLFNHLLANYTKSKGEWRVSN